MGFDPFQRRYSFDVLIFALLGVSILAIYYQAAGFGFIYYDDPAYVRDNPFVTQGLTRDSIAWAFTSLGYASNWHPLTWLSHMLDAELFGARPGMYHLTNVLLHILNSCLLYYLFRRMTGARWKSAAVAALFALHPLHVESVAWIAERKDVLSTFFLMLTIWAYLRYVEQRGTGGYVTTAILYALGLMAKPMLVSLPFMLLLLDFWPLNRLAPDNGRGGAPDGKSSAGPALIQWKGAIPLIVEKIPLLILALISSYITYLAQKAGNSVSSLDELPFAGRVANAVISYGLYLWHTVWPVHLAVFYPYPKAFSPIAIVSSLLLLVCISALALVQARRLPFLLMGWLWFLGTLVPVIGLVQVGFQSMADRYTYIPFIGIFIMAVWGGSALAGERKPVRYVLQGAFLAALVVLIGVSWSQAGYWKGSIPLFSHALEVTKDNYLAHTNLGAASMEEGDVSSLVEHTKEALRIKPDYVPALCNLGLGLIRQGRFQEALVPLRQAVQLNPYYLKAHLNLAYALYSVGDADGAAREYQEALRLNPQHPGALKGLQLVEAAQKKMDSFLSSMEADLRANPDNFALQLRMGMLYAKRGDTGPAIVHYEKALSLKPESPMLLQSLAMLYAKEGRMDDALSSLKKMSALVPELPDSYYNMACVYSRQGKVDESLRQLDLAIRKGFRNIGLLKTDPDLANIRGTRSYQQLMEKVR